MEQHDAPDNAPVVSPEGLRTGAPDGAAPSGGSKMRMVAIAATALALLGISIPFVWQPSAESNPVATMAGEVTPAASHGASAETAACMADAKPANFDFTFKNLDGKDVALSSYKGKVVLLNFWATWCGPCKAEIPAFVELQRQYGDKLAIVGFSVDDTAEQARAFAEQYKINYPILLGEGREELQEAYGPIWGIPASFLISKDGVVCRKHLGIAPKSVFDKEIAALM
ncbi:MAG: TlpA family protein disulfide reductase [Vicinamibacterales bacterium]